MQGVSAMHSILQEPLDARDTSGEAIPVVGEIAQIHGGT
jgi:hypothetical protein